MDTILIDTQHDCTPKGGGQRRTSQISYLARAAGFEAIHLPLERSGEHRGRVVSGLGFAAQSRFPLQFSLRAVRSCGLAVQAYRRALSQHRGTKILLRERTGGVGKVAARIASEFGFKSVAVPQNIESLVPEQTDEVALPRAGWGALRNEVNHFRLDAATFCISREEQWFLNVNGIDAGCLPYFPIPDWEAELLGLRQIRRPALPRRFLILGSAANPPVRRGIVELANLAGPIAAKLGCHIDVAGNDTQELKIDPCSGAVTNHGTVSAEHLSSLLMETTAAIVLQRAGCGALTKLPEFLIAGIPVIANANALRSAYHYRGVHEFESNEELEALMQADLPVPPPPDRPRMHETRFIDQMRRLAGDCSRAAS